MFDKNNEELNDKVLKIIAEKLKLTRNQLLKKQEEVEETAQLSHKYLTNLEAGHNEPLITTYYNWCKALGVNGHTLIDEIFEELEAEDES